MWTCEKCLEEIEDNFDSCWNCADAKMIEKEAVKEAEKENRMREEVLEKDAEKNWKEFWYKDVKNEIVDNFGRPILGAIIAAILLMLVGYIMGW